jgi:hypothetical protein
MRTRSSCEIAETTCRITRATTGDQRADPSVRTRDSARSRLSSGLRSTSLTPNATRFRTVSDGYDETGRGRQHPPMSSVTWARRVEILRKSRRSKMQSLHVESTKSKGINHETRSNCRCNCHYGHGGRGRCHLRGRASSGSNIGRDHKTSVVQSQRPCTAKRTRERAARAPRLSAIHRLSRRDLSFRAWAIAITRRAGPGSCPIQHRSRLECDRFGFKPSCSL